MKYFRLSNDEIMHKMSFADLVLLGASIPKSEDQEKSGNNKVEFNYFANKYTK